MKQNWVERHFGWIKRDVRELIETLKQGQTWVLLGLLTGFFILTLFTVRLALRSDTMLRALHPAVTMCRELGENAVAFVFVGMIFLALTMLATLGEFFTYMESNRRHAHHSARAALRGTAAWGAAAMILGLTILFFLDSRCI